MGSCLICLVWRVAPYLFLSTVERAKMAVSGSLGEEGKSGGRATVRRRSSRRDRQPFCFHYTAMLCGGDGRRYFYEMRGSFDLNVLESESIRHVLRFASSSSRFFFDCTMSGQREGEHELVDPRCQKERTEAMALAREERGEEREAERQGARGGLSP